MHEQISNLGDHIEVVKFDPRAGLVDYRSWYKPVWTIERFADDDARAAGAPYDVSEFEGNVALNSGKAEINALIIGDNANTFAGTNATLGVGDSATAEGATQTDLQAASNKLYKACTSTWPKLVTTAWTNDTIEAKTDFGSTEANYAWEEFVLKQITSLICLNRKVSAQGTKTSGQTWTLTLSLVAA